MWRGTCVSQGSRKNHLWRSVVWTEIWRMETAVGVRKGRSPEWGRGDEAGKEGKPWLPRTTTSFAFLFHHEVNMPTEARFPTCVKNTVKRPKLEPPLADSSFHSADTGLVPTVRWAVLADLGTLQCAKPKFSLLGLRGNVSHLEKIGNKNKSLNQGCNLLCSRGHSHTPGCFLPLPQKWEQFLYSRV